MIRFRQFAALAAMVLLSITSPASAARDWSTVVSATRDGGYLIGRPDAPHHLIEYFSLTCPHCRHFAEEGMAPLRKTYVATGKVTLELRNFVLNGPDFAASLLMRCAPPATAVKLFDQVYADQDKIFAPAANLSAEAQARINAAPDAGRAAAFAREIGLDAWFIARGVPAKQAPVCLADPARAKQLVDMRNAGEAQFKVPGTPAFILDGVLIDGVDWASVEKALKAVVK